MSKADIIRGLLQQAIDLAGGSQAKLGEAAKRYRNGKLEPYSQNAIHHAFKNGRVSPTMAASIERATGVSRKKLCPEAFND